MSKFPSFEMLVPILSRLSPIKSVIYIGEYEAGAIQLCLSEYSNKLILLCHNIKVDSQNSESETSNIYNVLCSDSNSTKTYYRTSLETENGLIDPSYLKKYWKNISTKSSLEREVITLDSYLAEKKVIQNVQDVNWLVIDMLSSGDVISGAEKIIENLDCIAVKLLFDKAADVQLEKNTFTKLSIKLASRGFIFFDGIKNINPSTGYAFFIKDWNKSSLRLKSDNLKLEASANDLSISLAELDERHSVLKSEHEKLEASNNKLSTSLTELDERYSVLKSEHEKLEASANDLSISLGQLEDRHSFLKSERQKLEASNVNLTASLTELDERHTLLKSERENLATSNQNLQANIAKMKANENVIAALTPELQKIQEGLAVSQKEASNSLNVGMLSKNLQETTQSLKLSTKLHLKKELDYKELEKKYAKLLESTQQNSTKKKPSTVGKEPIRIIHHLSCTGGTLLAKCIAAQPNILLLNEVDPLSTILVNTKKAEFTPTDLIGLMRQADNAVDPKLLADVFLDGFNTVKKHLTSKGVTLVARDHSHGKYLTGEVIPNRQSFKDIVSKEHNVISLVTTRHPIDSFLSMQKNGWDKHFSPSTIEEYSKRYLKFLDDMSGCDIIKYEDFVDDPQGVMRKICLVLKIPYDAGFIDIYDAFSFSGASGRVSTKIGKRERRDISDSIMHSVSQSQSYNVLIERLGY